VPAEAALLAHRRVDDVLAYDGGRPIRVSEFLADVQALAATLPAQLYVLNACDNRYLFTVALAAALLRGQITLLPSSLAAATVQTLALGYDGLYALSDKTDLPLPTVEVARLGKEPASNVPSVPAQQIALILFTSGSTGQPVPTAKTWGSLVYSAVSEAQALDLRPHSPLAILGTVPAQHSYGLESTVLLALHNGFALHSSRPLFPADVCAALEQIPRPCLLVTTPVHLRALCALDTPLPPVDLLLSATAPLTDDLAREAEERFAAPLMEIYGCSEAGQLAARTTTRSPEWRLMRDIRMRQDGTGTWVAGGHVPAETLLADVIELRADQRFVLIGRTADMVNIAGKRTSLSYLNHQLNAIPGVQDGVFYLPDGDESQGVVRLSALVVAPGLSLKHLRAALSLRIDAAFMPRPLNIVESLPRNSTGKLTREALLDVVGQLRRSAP